MTIVYDTTSHPHQMQLFGSNTEGFPLRTKVIKDAIKEAKDAITKIKEAEGTFSSMDEASKIIKAIDIFMAEKITIEQKE